MWKPDTFLEKMYIEKTQNHAIHYGPEWQKELLGNFQNALGRYPDFAKEMNPVILEVCEKEDYTRVRLQLQTYPELTMPIYFLIPKTHGKQVKKLPVVMALHGHGYGSKEVVGLKPDGSEISGEKGIHKDFGVELVKKGVMVVAPELIGFGDRRMSRDQHSGNVTDNSCFALASSLLLQGRTLAGLRINECRRLLDYLLTRDDTDMERIGCMGLSGGGLVAAYTAVLDKRIKAAVISGYVNTFKGSILDRNHCLDNYIPSILEYAEMPELIGLIAPRPLFIESGLGDKVFPSNHAMEAYSKLREIYSVFGAESAVDTHFFDGAHEINGERSYDWLINHLKLGRDV
ncbi:alpha/beta hydrolase family protein [Sutcliffiella deserti]|uniref:alpha/beta hydrolase family protein n=1 Tax=Sutcliffiella deserti TaxID=2875501 RepID=UPI001CBEA8EA|nr:alpha/beta hydrolase family protein [Sutcliffiella deserti]